MPGKLFPTLILIIAMNACMPNVRPTPEVTTHTLLTSTNTSIIPTHTQPVPTKDSSPIPAYSSTFTPIAPIQPDDALVLTAIHMMDESNGWGIEMNGHILHTKDGATTWQDVTPPQGAYTDAGFFALDGMNAWATSYCLGSAFGINTPKSPFCDDFGNGPNHTFVWITHDGGNSWGPNEIDLAFEGRATQSGSMYPEFIRFIDADHGWLSISFGSLKYQDRYNIFYTEDGGKEWEFVVSNLQGPSAAAISGAIPLDAHAVILASNNIYGIGDPNHDLTYHLSTDDGKTWDNFLHFSPPDNPLGDPVWDILRCGTRSIESIQPPALSTTQECIFLDESPGDHGLYGYHFFHFHSMDGGKTWNYWQQTGDVDFINDKTGWQLVSKGGGFNELQHTQDGGATWSTIKTLEWDGILNFVDEQTGWALAYQEGGMAVVKTTDGGSNWEIKSQALLPFIPCTINTWSYCDR